MNQGTEFIFKRRSTISYGLLICCEIGIAIYAAINLLSRPVILVCALAAPGVMFYLQCYSFNIINQFNKYDRDKTVLISNDKQMLTLTQGYNTITIHNSEVLKVELYGQKYLGNLGTFNYIVIFTTDNRMLLITNFTIPLLLLDKRLEKFLRKKPRFYIRKRFNYINEIFFNLPQLSNPNFKDDV